MSQLSEGCQLAAGAGVEDEVLSPEPLEDFSDDDDEEDDDESLDFSLLVAAAVLLLASRLSVR